MGAVAIMSAETNTLQRYACAMHHVSLLRFGCMGMPALDMVCSKAGCNFSKQGTPVQAVRRYRVPDVGC